ncbi:hypothetical protein M9458_029201, partial [Cirrhinus mrigala]
PPWKIPPEEEPSSHGWAQSGTRIPICGPVRLASGWDAVDLTGLSQAVVDIITLYEAGCRSFLAVWNIVSLHSE